MKIPAIKQLVENYNILQLKDAEQALLEEQQLAIEIPGEDDGEKLTHILAAVEILEDIAKGDDFTKALRKYTQRVRNSIN
jgi:hypothetical protein